MKVKVRLRDGNVVKIKASKDILNELSIMFSNSVNVIPEKDVAKKAAFLGDQIYYELKKVNYYVADIPLRKLAERMRKSGEWNPNDCQTLCRYAGLEDDYIRATSEEVEEVVFRAASELNVVIY